MPETYTVERSITVDAPAEQIHPHLADFHRWTAWSPWEDLDPQLRRTYSGPDEGPGATYAWSGNRKAGKGEMRITESLPPTRVEVTLAFEKPFPSQSTTSFTLTPQDGSTRVTWTMVGPRTRMLRLLSPVLSMDKLVGRDFEKGLARLKGVVESA